MNDNKKLIIVIMPFILWVLAGIFIDVVETILFHPQSWIIFSDWMRNYYPYSGIFGDGYHAFKQFYLWSFAGFGGTMFYFGMNVNKIQFVYWLSTFMKIFIYILSLGVLYFGLHELFFHHIFLI